MKTEITDDMELQLFDITEVDNTYKVEYDPVDDAGVAQVKTFIKKETLYNFIQSNHLNFMWDFGKQFYLPLREFLDDNYRFVINSYLLKGLGL